MTCSAHIFASLESDFAALECLANCTLLLVVRLLLSTGMGWDNFLPPLLLGVEHASSVPVLLLTTAKVVVAAAANKRLSINLFLAALSLPAFSSGVSFLIAFLLVPRTHSSVTLISTYVF